MKTMMVRIRYLETASPAIHAETFMGIVERAKK